MLAISISFPHRHSGNSVQPGIKRRSNADMNPLLTESDLSRFAAMHNAVTRPLVPASFSIDMSAGSAGMIHSGSMAMSAVMRRAIAPNSSDTPRAKP
jgi:hypothetical protein